MKRLVLVCLAATALLISAGPRLTGDALGAPPEYGTIEGNTWTNQFSMNEKDYLTYSFSPVPEVIMLGATQVYSLKPGNTMAWKDAGIRMYSIIEFDYSELGEHLIADSPVYESRGDSSFTFSRPGLFSVHLLDADSPIMMLTIQVTDGGERGALEAQEKTFTNDLGMEFVLMPAGSFMMGSDPSSTVASDDEKPQHQVTISRPFYLGMHEVTQEQWKAVMGDNPSDIIGQSNPVGNVSWDDVQVFIEKLNTKESRGKYRLPTEAEWEYAARAGTDTAYFFGDDAGELGQYAWYDENSGDKTHPVGQKQPNPWGLYDMYGNVWEWVGDWYGDKYYADSPATDPKGPSSGSSRAYRGGSWYDTARYCRSAFRDLDSPDSRLDFLGFRLALSPGQ